MNKRLLKRIFPVIAILLLTPWPVAYAYDADGAGALQEIVKIQAAQATDAPSMAVFGKAISGVKPGDLFYIDSADHTSDIKVTLYLTNTHELRRNYRYVILKVGVYVKDNAGSWVKASLNNGNPVPDTFITLHNGQASFNLYGYESYKLTLDSGSLNCVTTRTEGGNLTPKFYLEVA